MSKKLHKSKSIKDNIHSNNSITPYCCNSYKDWKVGRIHSVQAHIQRADRQGSA